MGGGETIPGDKDVASVGGSTAAAGPTDMDVASSGGTSNMDVPLVPLVSSPLVFTLLALLLGVPSPSLWLCQRANTSTVFGGSCQARLSSAEGVVSDP